MSTVQKQTFISVRLITVLQTIPVTSGRSPRSFDFLPQRAETWVFSVFLAERQRQRRRAAGSWRDAVHPGDQAVSDRKWRRSGQLWAGTRKESFVADDHSCLLEFVRLRDVPLVEFVYLVLTCMPGKSTAGNSGLCCCACVVSFEHLLTPLCVDSGS